MDPSMLGVFAVENAQDKKVCSARQQISLGHIRRTRSAVSVLAVEDAFDLEVIAVIAEEDAVVLGAQPD